MSDQETQVISHCEKVLERLDRYENRFQSVAKEIDALGRVAESHDGRIRKVEDRFGLENDRMEYLKKRIEENHFDMRDLAKIFKKFDEKVDGHIENDNRAQKRILFWVIISLVGWLVAISGWGIDFILTRLPPVAP